MRAWSRALCVALVVLAAACTGSEPSSETTSAAEVRIGLLAPLSGPDKAIGTDSERGAQLAAALLSGEEGEVSLAGIGSGGLSRLGRPKVTIISGNTGSDAGGDAAQGAREANRLVTAERVVGLVGAYHADVTSSASRRSERLRVPFVNGDASADFLTENGLDGSSAPARPTRPWPSRSSRPWARSAASRTSRWRRSASSTSPTGRARSPPS